MKITIAEIAQLAGVSKTTVSRVLNNKPDVDPETRDGILKLINEHDYHPNAFAKAISLQKSHTIGLIIPHEVEYIFTNPFYVEIMRGVSTELDRMNYHLLISYVHKDNYLEIYKQKRVDGYILLSPGSTNRDIIDDLNQFRVPFVSTAKISDNEDMISVDVDNYLGAILAMDHLISLGHKQIAFIGKQGLTSSQDRLKGFYDKCSENSLPTDERMIVISGSSSIKGGYCSMTTILQSGAVPTAVFIANDVMAFGAIKTLQDHGLKVPDDVSIVGFDDIPMAEYFSPPLTTIHQPTFEKGVKAARLLIKYLENKTKPKSLILGLELTVRKSTAPVKEMSIA